MKRISRDWKGWCRNFPKPMYDSMQLPLTFSVFQSLPFEENTCYLFLIEMEIPSKGIFCQNKKSRSWFSLKGFSQFNSFVFISQIPFYSMFAFLIQDRRSLFVFRFVEFLLGNTNDVLLDLVALFQSRPCMKLFHSKKGHRLSIWKKSHWLKEFLVFFKSSRFYSIPMFIWEE